MGEEYIIRFENVCKSYGEKEILKDLNLYIKKGEFITIIGSSGCGKTTALKLINGLLSPEKGKVYVNNQDISKVDPIQLRRNIGYVIQGVGLFPHINIRKNIGYVLSLNKIEKKLSESIIEKYASIVKLDEELLDRYPSEISGGQKQRVGIARALVSSPDILLMDEPFGAVDEITRKSLQDEISRIHKELNVTIIFITHDIKEALKLGNRVIVMDNGRIHQIGTPEEVVNSPKTSFVEQLVCA